MSASGRGRLASRAWGRRAAVSGAGVVAFFYTGTGPVEVQTPTASTRNPPGKQPAAPSTPIRGSGLRIRGSVHGWASEMLLTPPGCITKMVVERPPWRSTDLGRSTHQTTAGIAGAGDPSARSHEQIDRRAERRIVAINGQAFLFARTAPQATGSIAASETLLTNGRSHRRLILCASRLPPWDSRRKPT
jgi:hypothetical protein